MNSLELQLKALVKFLSEQRIKYIILGGIAVSIYGEPRLTADIDVNIILGKTRIREFLNKAKKYGFYPLFSDVKKIAEKTGVIPLKFIKGKAIGKCDIIIAENILEYTAIERGRIRRIDSIRARLVSAEDLIIHKVTSSRPRDIEDFKSILIRQRGKLNTKYIIGWLKKIDRANKKSRLCKLFKEIRQR